MMEKRYRLVGVSISPQRVVNGELIPALISCAYATDIVDGDETFVSKVHRHTGPLNALEAPISGDGTVKPIEEILQEAGLVRQLPPIPPVR